MEVPGVVGLTRIGAGGFAEVYRGVLGETGDPVAVKVFAPGTEQRVDREAAALTEVGAPLVPRLYRRTFTPDGRPVLIMELVSGTTLGAASVTRASQEEKLDALWRSAVTVDRLHDTGWMHRDLKPDHVVLRNQRVTLLDLGAALRCSEAAAHVVEEPGVDPMALTADGAALGTPRYMAPEQCTGLRAIGPAADIYSLGVIAFELLAARPPFVGEPAVIRSAHMATQPPRLSSLVDVPRAADEVMMRCLAKDPALRHGRATEFAAALTAALAQGSDERPLALPADSSPRRMALLAVRSRRSVVDFDRALGPRAILARAQGDRLVIALPAPGPTSTAVLSALRLADRLRAALEVEDAVVHVAELRVRRRGTRLAFAGPALDDLGWADRPRAGLGSRGSLTPDAAGELDATTLAIVTGSSGAPTTTREPTLVGRSQALAEVASDAARGAGLVTVLGGAGIGKTRFLAELARELDRRGIGPVALVSARDLAIARNVPLAAALAGDGPPPAVILVDDAHVADSAALDAIELASLDRPAAWVCVAAMPELVSKRPAWDARALRAGRWTLDPLGPDDAASVLHELLAAEFMPDAVMERLVEASAGVPLHLVELALTLHQSGALRSRPGTDGIYVAADHLVHLSSTPLGERMAERALSEMPPSSVLFARLCAVLGDDVELVEVETAQRAAGGDEWVDAGVGLHRLCAAGVLTQVGPTRWRFEHRMLRQGVLTGTPAGEREMLHRAALAVEEERPEPRFDRLAEHASAIGDRERAWRAYHALATASAEAGDFIEAELAWTSALGHLPPSDPRREQALVGRGHARQKLQGFDESLVDLGSALELALSRGDLRAAANIRLDEATVHDWRMQWEESRAAAVAAEQLASSEEDPVLAARVELALGRSACRMEQVVPAIEALTGVADSTGADDETRTIALVMLAPLLVYADRNADAEERFQQVISLCRTRGDDFHLAAALLNRSMLWFRLDRLDETEADLRRSIEVARRHGASQLERYANINLAETLYWEGRPAEALVLAERALSLQSRFSGSDDMSDDALLVARIQLSGGDRDGATRARARAGAPETPKQQALARMVDLVLARAPAAEWDEVDRGTPTIYAELGIEFALWATRSALEGGDRDGARAWLKRARERAGDRRAWQGQISDLTTHVGGT
ncbi:MAG TPA: protein kinase [Kofleriaceae bacterium]|nr:protein kinase [Kofleriaceae bacterium]